MDHYDRKPRCTAAGQRKPISIALYGLYVCHFGSIFSKHSCFFGELGDAPNPGNPDIEQPGQVVGRFTGAFSPVPPKTSSGQCAAGCRQALFVALSWFRQVALSHPTWLSTGVAVPRHTSGYPMNIARGGCAWRITPRYNMMAEAW